MKSIIIALLIGAASATSGCSGSGEYINPHNVEENIMSAIECGDISEATRDDKHTAERIVRNITGLIPSESYVLTTGDYIAVTDNYNSGKSNCMMYSIDIGYDSDIGYSSSDLNKSGKFKYYDKFTVKGSGDDITYYASDNCTIYKINNVNSKYIKDINTKH